jgi:hypothetical protein
MKIRNDKRYKLEIIEIIEEKPIIDKNGCKIGCSNDLLKYGMTVKKKFGNSRLVSYLEGNNIKDLLNKFLIEEGYKIKFKDKVRKWLRSL